jgi:acetyl esterase/lipase
VSWQRAVVSWGAAQVFPKKARAAGVPTHFRVWPKMSHVWQIYAPFLPEARRALKEAADFVTQVLA